MYSIKLLKLSRQYVLADQNTHHLQKYLNELRLDLNHHTLPVSVNNNVLHAMLPQSLLSMIAGFPHGLNTGVPTHASIAARAQHISPYPELLPVHFFRINAPQGGCQRHNTVGQVE